MKDHRVHFENGRIKRNNVTHINGCKVPPEFKELADTFFSELRRIEERINDVKS